MFSVLFKLAGSRVGQLVLVGLLGLGVGAYTHKRFTPPTTTTQVIHDVQQVRVEVPVLSEKIVDRVITDPKQQEAINRLLKENHDLKVTQVSSTVATNQSSGGTGAGTNDPSTGTITPNPVVQSNMPSSFTFKDWQLNATFLVDGSKFSYGLSQTFIIESSTGHGSDGKPVGLTRLFQESPNGLLPIPAKTTVVQADPNPNRWYINPRGQLGIGVTQDKTKVGLLALQWLKKGTSTDPKDTKWAIGSPFIATNGQYGVLPVSLNLGAFKYDPVSNAWVSVSVDKAKNLGLSLSITF